MIIVTQVDKCDLQNFCYLKNKQRIFHWENNETVANHFRQDRWSPLRKPCGKSCWKLSFRVRSYSSTVDWIGMMIPIERSRGETPLRIKSGASFENATAIIKLSSLFSRASGVLLSLRCSGKMHWLPVWVLIWIFIWMLEQRVLTRVLPMVKHTRHADSSMELPFGNHLNSCFKD